MTKVFEIHRLENGWFTVKTDTDIEGNPYNRATGYSLVEPPIILCWHTAPRNNARMQDILTHCGVGAKPNREGACLLLREMLYEIIEELLPHNKHERFNVTVEVEERGE